MEEGSGGCESAPGSRGASRDEGRGGEGRVSSTNAPVPVETKTLVSSSGQLRKIFGADFFSVLYQCVRLWFPKFSKVYRTLHFL
jgi:hypothetical protein